jgi:hypothetical protein
MSVLHAIASCGLLLLLSGHRSYSWPCPSSSFTFPRFLAELCPLQLNAAANAAKVKKRSDVVSSIQICVVLRNISIFLNSSEFERELGRYRETI